MKPYNHHSAKDFEQKEVPRWVRLSTNVPHHILRQQEAKKPAEVATGTPTASAKKKKDTKVKFKKCVQCGGNASTRCVVCDVYLCNDELPDREPCCLMFHDPEVDVYELYKELSKKE